MERVQKIEIPQESKEEIFKILTATKFVDPLRIYTSSAGHTLPVTVNLRSVFSHPKALRTIAKQFDEIIKKNDIKYAAGFEVSGIPLSTAISLNSEIMSFTVRKEKHDHGMLSVIAGYVPDKDESIAIVDDGFASGKSLQKSFNNLKNEGYTNVQHYLYFLTTKAAFSEDNKNFLEENDVIMSYLVTYEEYIDWAIENGYISEIAGWASTDGMANQISWEEDKTKWDKFNKAKENGEVWVKYPDLF